MPDADPDLSLPAGDAASPVEPSSAPEPAPDPESLLPDDLRVSWTWTDVLIFFAFAVGAIVVLEYALQSILLTFGGVKLQGLKAHVNSTVFVAIRQFLLFNTLLAYLFFTLRPRRPEPFWETIGWRPPRMGALYPAIFYPLCLFGGAVLAIVIATASSLMAPKQPLPVQQFFLDKQSIYLMSILAVLVAPIVEETVFRGFLYPVFARTLGISGGIALTGILFGFLHAQQLWGGWWQIALLVLVGLIFTAVRARTRSVIPCFLLHLGYNAIQFVGFFFSAQFHKLPLIR
jgi:membrane protease YdiL (CAAX protease family)